VKNKLWFRDMKQLQALLFADIPLKYQLLDLKSLRVNNLNYDKDSIRW
jgi:hypothetical protein